MPTPIPRLLPLDDASVVLTDGGIETTLIFHEGLELPYFAAFHLLRDEAGRAAIRRYYTPFLDLARDRGTGFVLESPTWRANPDWGVRLGYDEAALDAANVAAIDLMQSLRRDYERSITPLLVSGCIGPRGDGYVADTAMTADEAAAYHGRQASVFADRGVDVITAITMTNVPEAIGIVRAAQAVATPVVIAFTTETDGRLPSGAVLADAIRAGGSSLRDYVQADGELGYFQHRFAVYDRAGARCPTPGCGGSIRRLIHQGRSSFYCPHCQH